MRWQAIAGVLLSLASSIVLADPPPPRSAKRAEIGSGSQLSDVVSASGEKRPAAVEGPSREVQRAVLQKMKSRKPNIRTAAVREMKAYPAAETARFLAQHGLASNYDDVRAATYQLLLELNGPGPIATYLLDAVAKEIKRPEPRPTLCAMLAATIASNDTEVEGRALELFDQTTERARAGILFALAMVDQLGLINEETSVSTLMKISKRRSFKKLFAVRRAVVQSLTKIALPKSTDALVELLTMVNGEVRLDIVRHLEAVTGQEFGVDPQAWLNWWLAQKGPDEQKRRNASTLGAMPAKSMYYGMPIYAGRLLFIIDTSASMSGLRIAAAKRELSAAILGLPDGTCFNVLSFDIVVLPWSPQLMPATPENKAAAITWVLARGLGPQTASYNALEAAFGFDTEAIYFLTDGEPAGGKVDNPPTIVTLITAMNQTRRMTINTLGIGVGLPGPFNPFDQFLGSLALLNYGEYRRVDQ